VTNEAVPEVVSSDRVYDGRFFAVTQAAIRFSDGTLAERAIVEHPGAVALVVIDDDGRWLLVEQYRHAARQRMLEVPAGTREPGEDPATTAARELREETGFAARSIVRIGGAWMAPGFTSEYIHYYLATDLYPAPLDSGDEEDLSAPVPRTLEELDREVASGRIEDAKTIVAMHFYRVHAAASAASRG